MEAARSPVTECFSLQTTYALASHPADLNRLPPGNLSGQATCDQETVTSIQHEFLWEVS